MKTIDISLPELRPAPWNPNQMDETMMSRLRESISRYGLVEPLVVRKIDEAQYEVLSGNQRLRVLQGMDLKSVPCVVVELNDTKAMLLAQALNGLRGEDDLALKGALLKEILSSVSEDEVLSLMTLEAKENGFDNPNTRGNAVFLLCKFYLERRNLE